jgi:hypothetical protein
MRGFKNACRRLRGCEHWSMRSCMAYPLIALVLSLGSGSLWAQTSAVRPVDPTRRQEQIGGRMWSGPGQARIGQKNPWPGSKTITFGSWHGSYSSLGRKMAPIEETAKEERRMARLGSGVKTWPRLGMSDTTSRFSGHKSQFRNFARVGSASTYGGDERIQSLITTEVEVSREEFAAGKGAPRLEDLNRFTYRKNGAAEDGPVPVSPAAGGTEPEASRR